MSAPDGLDTRSSGSVPLPKLILIADRFTQPAVSDRAVQAAEAGVGWVHLRDHEADDEAFERAAARLLQRLRQARPGVLVSINARVDIAVRQGTGLHLGAHGPPLPEAITNFPAQHRLVGCSAHTMDEAEAAFRAGAKYLVVSPIFSTRSKPGRQGIGLDALHAFVDAFPDVPVYALGGIEPENVKACLDTGAYGVAVLTGILAQPDPAASARAYLIELHNDSDR